MTKLALVLHGWPQTEINQHFLVNFLKRNGYEVIIPNLYEGVDFPSMSGIKPSKGNDPLRKNLTNYIISKLDDNLPQLIIGISMGGLILPHIAKMFPKSKLIFIASGVCFKPDLFLTKLGVVILKKKFLRNFLVNIGNNIPLKTIEFLYRLFDPFTGEDKDRDVYEKDLKLNLNEIKKHSFSKHLMLLDLICGIDNRDLLSTIGNKVLIFDGENDRLMGGGGKELTKFLENSKLIVNKGGHFNVFEERDMSEVEKFLS